MNKDKNCYNDSKKKKNNNTMSDRRRKERCCTAVRWLNEEEAEIFLTRFRYRLIAPGLIGSAPQIHTDRHAPQHRLLM